MIISDEATQQAVTRLAANHDFQLFLGWLKAEAAAGSKELLASLNPVLIHQLQGTTRALLEIIEAATPYQRASRS